MTISTLLLEAFVALEESLNFTQAADRCHVTQSAFSQMIRRLETDTGVRLFDRDTRSVRLTSAGQLFSTRAHRILLEINSALSEMRDYADLKMGRLALAIIPSLATGWLPKILAEYTTRYPRVSIDVFDSNPKRGLQLLHESRVEMEIASEPGESAEFSVRQLFREPIFLACASQHPIAEKRLLQLRDLADLPMMDPMYMGTTNIVTGKSRKKVWEFIRAARMADAGIVVEHFATLQTLVGAGLGVTLVPQMHAPLVPPGVVLVPIDKKVLLREVYLTQRLQPSLSAAASAFVGIMDRHIAAMSL